MDHLSAEEGQEGAHLKWEDLFQAISHPAIILNLEHEIVAVNHAVVEASGMSAEALIGSKCFQVLHGGHFSAPPDPCPLTKMLASGQMETTVMDIEAFGGTYLVSCAPLYNRQGTFTRVLHLAMDITGYKKTEEALREREETYRTLLSNIPDVVYSLDSLGKIKAVNDTVNHYGFKEGDLLGKPFLSVVYPEDRDLVQNTFLAAIKSQRVLTRGLQFRVQASDGAVRWAELTSRKTFSQGGQYLQDDGVLHDITDRRKEEDARRAAEELYRTLAEKSFAGVYVVQEGKFCFINSIAASYLGYAREELTGRSAGRQLHPEDREQVRVNAKAMLRGERTAPYEFRIITKQGQIRWMMETTNSISYEGRPAILGTSMDISDRKKMEEEIIALSVTDPLTGLFNRRGFIALAEQQLKIAERTGNGLLLLFADVDGMKEINDQWGHRKGDEALVEAAEVLKEVFRDADIVARVGGDEFAVLALGTSMEYSKMLKWRLQRQIDLHNTRNKREYRLSISLGIAYQEPENPTSIDDLMSRADALMYEQKKGKRP